MITIPGTDKFFAHSKEVNTTISGPESALEESHWYTIDELSNTVRPYKVFTALLTQNYGSSTGTAFGNDYIYKGHTYTIIALNPNDNLIPYGAPNNEIGTSFICNQDIFNWGDSASELSYQDGAPVATILENTIGNIWFVYNGVGYYSMLSDGLFIADKTTIFGGLCDLNAEVYIKIVPSSSSEIIINNGDPSSANVILQNTTIEIRVYN